MLPPDYDHEGDDSYRPPLNERRWWILPLALAGLVAWATIGFMVFR